MESLTPTTQHRHRSLTQAGVSAAYVHQLTARQASPHENQPRRQLRAASKETEIDDIESLAAQLANFKAPPVQETNDPTPISEQRKPFDDDEEIKVPTRQLAEIFVAQGAYAKAIKVYEALAEKEPHNAFLFNIIINGLRAQIK
jgi:hypothetical protein